MNSRERKITIAEKVALTELAAGLDTLENDLAVPETAALRAILIALLGMLVSGLMRDGVDEDEVTSAIDTGEKQAIEYRTQRFEQKGHTRLKPTRSAHLLAMSAALEKTLCSVLSGEVLQTVIKKLLADGDEQQ